jgi:flagellar biosynthesis/type III secretory pathway M-ring protein FliF/YscJ
VNWREDKTLIILGSAMVFFAVIVLIVVYLRPEDTQLYTLFATVFSNFSGALMLHLTREKVPPAGSTTVTDTHMASSVPPVPVDPPQRIS